MFEYIKGTLVEAAPAYAVVECGGIGYYISISVNTYSQIASNREVMLYLHQIVREDAHLLYGFASKEERTIFRQLISVSGIGANTASVMLSSMTVNEITGAIMTENVNAIKSVKGIGLKTAQRVIIELKDKVNSADYTESSSAGPVATIREEALAALVMLGFVKVQAAKVVDKIVAAGGITSVEELIKRALKQL
ncbi:MAG: Holliday junction branch migration protein RuvA [Odoribacter sp.]|nr:Holliday junction branch migration protein RuvA [Odoribacter sp.]